MACFKCERLIEDLGGSTCAGVWGDSNRDRYAGRNIRVAERCAEFEIIDQDLAVRIHVNGCCCWVSCIVNDLDLSRLGRNCKRTAQNKCERGYDIKHENLSGGDEKSERRLNSSKTNLIDYLRGSR